MTIKTEGNFAGEFLISEATRTRSRDAIVIDQNQTLVAGAVLGKKNVGAPTVTPAKAEGAGTGALGTWTADAGAPAGVYQARCIAAAANAGTFDIFKPDGTPDGQATVGVAYNGTVNGTIADGATDWAVGDVIDITVSYAEGSDLYVAINSAATDGSQNFAGILFDAVTTGAGENKKAVAITRHAEVDGALLDYNGQTGATLAATKAQVAAKGIVIR